MLNSLKAVLVSSFVGTIAIGWIFAQAMLHFAYVFSAPITSWLVRREYRNFMDRPGAIRGISLQDSVPELVKSLALALLGYLLLRWLYISPLVQEKLETGTENNPQS
jgi:hypothetical protein